MKLFFALIWLSLSLVCDPNLQRQNQNGKIVGGGCDGCEAIYEGMPKSLSWETTIPDAKEPGEPLEISGTIYKADGIDEIRFDDDPLLTKGERSNEEKRGGSGIIKLTKNQNGVWIGRRDIVLGLNIPNYK